MGFCYIFACKATDQRRNSASAVVRTMQPGWTIIPRLFMTSKIYLRQPELVDEQVFLNAARQSHTLHQPWTTAPASSAEFRAYVERMAQASNKAFFVCRRDTDALVGVINITNIVLGQFCSAYLGFYAFAGQERQGFMREGLQALTQHAFTALQLHRLEANIQPDNAASIDLVTACGFAKEGFSPRYLKIGDQWRDHERWAILAS